VSDRSESDSHLPRDDRPIAQLDDVEDREELRTRYYGFLQELRVVLPGVTVLLGFLMVVPFSQRFGQVDDRGRAIFTVALVSGATSAVCLLTPTVLHRLGERTARRERLLWGIRVMLVGMAALAVSTVAAVWTVLRAVDPSWVSAVLTGGVALLIVLLWVVLPRTLARGERRSR
jgi:hypothetical protein